MINNDWWYETPDDPYPETLEEIIREVESNLTWGTYKTIKDELVRVQTTCKCGGYNFPHRHKSSKCEDWWEGLWDLQPDDILTEIEDYL